MTETEFNNDVFSKLSNRPHVVILGAGASCATILNGDKNGRKISAMDNFIQELGMEEVLSSIKLKTTSTNLEDIYSELYERSDCNEVRMKLESKIRDYFKRLELPDEPTIYDYLLLSLREKDLIISFNWDDLLLQARKRVQKITKNLPEMAFLHGNVGVGYCKNDDSYGLRSNRCDKCGERYEASQLLYPIREKDYNSAPQLQKQWEGIKTYIHNAGYISIFGYGIPTTDVEVKRILLNAFKYGEGEYRIFEEIEIIDKKDCNKEQLINRWSEFIKITHEHYEIRSSFYDSILSKSPRRSIEAHLKTNFANWWGESSISFTDLPKTFNEIKDLILPLLDNEIDNNFAVI